MATRHYSPKNFFRQLPNALLARYFHGQGVLGELDFSAMKESKPDALFAAWLALPEAQRHAMDMEFQEIFGISCEKGCRAIIDEAEWQLRETLDAYAAFIEQLAALPNHYERAMVTFLDHHHFWKGATRFYHAETLSYWRKRKPMLHRSAAVDEASLQHLASLICGYFHHTEGRGNHCVVEPFRRGDPKTTPRHALSPSTTLRRALPKGIGEPGAQTRLSPHPPSGPDHRGVGLSTALKTGSFDCNFLFQLLNLPIPGGMRLGFALQ